MDRLLGYGTFTVELVNDSQGNPVVRADVSYLASDKDHPPYQLVFEAKPTQEPYELRLVTKGK